MYVQSPSWSSGDQCMVQARNIELVAKFIFSYLIFCELKVFVGKLSSLVMLI